MEVELTSGNGYLWEKGERSVKKTRFYRGITLKLLDSTQIGWRLGPRNRRPTVKAERIAKKKKEVKSEIRARITLGIRKKKRQVRYDRQKQ